MPDAPRPLASVVIPTKDRLPYLRHAVASVLSQSVTDLECIVVDDFSSDGTREWLSSTIDPRLRPLLLPRPCERSAARNAGLAEVRSPFVLFLDDDDLLAPHALERSLRVADRHPDAALIVGRQVMFEASGRRKPEPHPMAARPVAFWRAAMLGLTYVSGQVMIGTGDVRDVGGWDPSLSVAEDQDLWIRLGPGRRAAFTGRATLFKRHRMAVAGSVGSDRATADRVRRRHVATLRGTPFGCTAQALYDARLAYVAALDAYSAGRLHLALRHLGKMVRCSPGLLVDPLVAPSFGRFVTKVIVRGMPGADHAWRFLRPHLGREGGSP